MQDLLKSLSKNMVKNIEYKEECSEYYHLNLIATQ